MNVLFSSDLHGNTQQYINTVSLAVKLDVRAVVFGGDLAPKAQRQRIRGGRYYANMLREQQSWIAEVAAPALRLLKAHGILAFACMGNGDVSAAYDCWLELERDGLITALVDCRRVPLGRGTDGIAYELVGLPHVPFSWSTMKDFEVHDCQLSAEDIHALAEDHAAVAGAQQALHGDRAVAGPDVVHPRAEAGAALPAVTSATDPSPATLETLETGIDAAAIAHGYTPFEARMILARAGEGSSYYGSKEGYVPMHSTRQRTPWSFRRTPPHAGSGGGMKAAEVESDTISAGVPADRGARTVEEDKDAFIGWRGVKYPPSRSLTHSIEVFLRHPVFTATLAEREAAAAPFSAAACSGTVAMSASASAAAGPSSFCSPLPSAAGGGSVSNAHTPCDARTSTTTTTTTTTTAADAHVGASVSAPAGGRVRTVLVAHSPPFATTADICVRGSPEGGEGAQAGGRYEPCSWCNPALSGAGLQGTGLDTAYESSMRYPHTHVGSVALRRFIREQQPWITLHGHIHGTTGEDASGTCIQELQHPRSEGGRNHDGGSTAAESASAGGMSEESAVAPAAASALAAAPDGAPYRYRDSSTFVIASGNDPNYRRDVRTGDSDPDTSEKGGYVKAVLLDLERPWEARHLLVGPGGRFEELL